MGNEHTPGPWEPVRSLTCGHLRAAHNYNSDPKKEWTDADILLISAAPELLDACKAALSIDAISPNCEEVYNQIRAAIIKAKG